MLSDSDSDDEGALGDIHLTMGAEMETLCSHYNGFLSGIEFQFQTDFWNPADAIPTGCNFPSKGGFTVALYDKTQGKQIASATGYVISQADYSPSAPCFNIEMICSQTKGAGYMKLCVLLLMRGVIAIVRKGTRIEQIVAYCLELDLSAEGIKSAEYYGLESRKDPRDPLDSSRNLIWTRSYSMFLSLGFIGCNIRNVHVLTRELVQEVKRKQGESEAVARGQSGEDVCAAWKLVASEMSERHPKKIFDVTTLGRESIYEEWTNYSLVWEWMLRPSIRGRGTSCRLQDILGIQRQGMGFNVFYPLWIPELDPSDACEIIDKRLDGNIMRIIES